MGRGVLDCCYIKILFEMASLVNIIKILHSTVVFKQWMAQQSHIWRWVSAIHLTDGTVQVWHQWNSITVAMVHTSSLPITLMCKTLWAASPVSSEVRLGRWCHQNGESPADIVQTCMLCDSHHMPKWHQSIEWLLLLDTKSELDNRPDSGILVGWPPYSTHSGKVVQCKPSSVLQLPSAS